nr:aminotransferase class V-fold PLP-dependent enzyme [Mobilitalea sibirica]
MVQYSKEGYYPMHMPGHKRNTGLLSMVDPYSIDITEVDGFDNLHQAEGILKKLSSSLEDVYRAKRSYPLVNGSTAGILAGISAVTKRGDKILLSRNAHKSVYNAVILNDLKPYYLYPETVEDTQVFGGISALKTEEMLIKHQDIKLVIITSPTYEGVVSDITGISRVVHQYGALLMVDEAHGAHFGLHEYFPKSAITSGADIIVQSLHKTLPAFTQSSILHCNREDYYDKIEKYLAIYQSSSPSYVLMAGIDRCLELLREQGPALFEAYKENLIKFYDFTKSLERFQLLNKSIIGKKDVYDLDPSKLTIMMKTTDLTGYKLANLLQDKYRIVMEMASEEYALGMTSICDTKEGFHRLKKALLEIDKANIHVDDKPNHIKYTNVQPKQVMTPSEAMEQPAEEIELTEKCCGRICATMVSLFPPGNPLLIPGEIIDDRILSHILKAKQSGGSLTGLAGNNKNFIRVII